MDEKIARWSEEFWEIMDEIVFLSNRHHKKHGKACLRFDGSCKAHFLHEVRHATTVDKETGALEMKKLEA